MQGGETDYAISVTELQASKMHNRIAPGGTLNENARLALEQETEGLLSEITGGAATWLMVPAFKFIAQSMSRSAGRVPGGAKVFREALCPQHKNEKH